MPIYEFYCPECHMIFNFFSASVNTEKRPLCPRCKKVELDRSMSVFATVKHRGEEDEGFPAGDEAQMERAMSMLAKEAENLDENNPKQAADLMRKLTDMTGVSLGPGMEEALRRMELGDDPEKIEEEMGDILEEEEPFTFKQRALKARKALPPRKDENLYDL